MNKIIIGLIAIVIIITLVVVGVAYVGGTDTGPPILPDGTTPDDTTPDDTPIAEINIDYPANCTISKKGPWHSIDVEGTIYGANIGIVSKVIVAWHTGIAYGKQEISSSSFDQYDQYNTLWITTMLIDRLGSGDHTLTVKAIDSSGDTVSQDNIIVTIPEYYIYEWNSNNPRRGDSAYPSNGYYGFTFPYKSDDGEWFWLDGEILKVKGQVHRTWASGWDHGSFKLWLDIWNGHTDTWTIASKDVFVGELAIGWLDVDVSVSNVWGNSLGFAGTIDVDIVDGFIGEVWIKPGTIYYQQSPLEFVMSIFGGDSFDNPPHP